MKRQPRAVEMHHHVDRKRSKGMHHAKSRAGAPTRTYRLLFRSQRLHNAPHADENVSDQRGKRVAPRVVFEQHGRRREGSECKNFRVGG